MTIAFVAGATGFVGKALVQALRDCGVGVVAHVRPDSKRLGHWQQHFAAAGATVDTAPWQPLDLAAALRNQGTTHVFCCIGTTAARKRGSSAPASESYEAVDYGLTRMLVEAALAAGGVQRFVYLSSAGAGPEAAGAYLQARWRAEEAVRGGGLPYTIARPSFIVGDRDDDRPFERWGATLADAALIGAGLLGATKLRDRYRSTDDRTLAAALVRVGFDAGTVNETVTSESLRGA